MNSTFPFTLPPCPFYLEDESRLQLEHPRRIDVRKRRDGVPVCAYCVSWRKLSESGEWGREIAIGRNPAAEEVAMIENVEALQP